ncbi:MAG: DUF1778 domain-containing protein [Gammaproteobacteria bacterium]|nr:DUF1778 domain-containing protein [Gammaproteobacteria bacterium]
MSSVTQTKDDRINLRLRHDTKLMLERAAGFEGQTVNKFVLGSALAHAEKIIKKHQVMQLYAGNSETLFNALAGPVHFNDKLEAALDEHTQRVTSK